MSCGACVGGVVLVNGCAIERCDDCKLYPDDLAAAASVWTVWENEFAVGASAYLDFPGWRDEQERQRIKSEKVFGKPKRRTRR